ncbi:MAG: hypothetical protein IJE28_08020 [Oscillospiraceae bacterium]|nr:hypothetical protein [Oscillospiraceae bacterium]MBQ3501563.1 hypothetical protein [Oscillospiraceae bacterium]MBQ4643037.1 hypothetical protein [Oscillospiraceae bacterium]MBQ7054453.1 hypothetical protein [Oscillospiraceae bacterium]
MIIKAVCEYNDEGCLVYAENFPGAFVRGRKYESAIAKFPKEIESWLDWAKGEAKIDELFEIELVQEKKNDELRICDADSDVIFDSEREPLTKAEYNELKILALRSAMDLERMYDSIPDKKMRIVPERDTFYGKIPSTAEEMYNHCMNITEYYFGEIDVPAENGPDILTCRQKGFEELEKQENFLENKVFDGSYGEEWSLRKVLRRFIWHDRIHARAMYRRAYEAFWDAEIDNVFCFKRK